MGQSNSAKPWKAGIPTIVKWYKKFNHVHLSWREAETRTYEAKQISIEASAAFIPSSLFSHSNTLSLTDGLTGHAIAKLGFVLFLETYVHEVRCIQFHLVAADSSSMRCNSLFAGLGLARGSFSPSKYSDWRTESSELEGKPKPRQSLKTFYLLHSFISNFDIFFQQQTSWFFRTKVDGNEPQELVGFLYLGV